MNLTAERAPTFLLIPGAGGDSWYWHRLVDELDRRGFASVPVDLPAGDDGARLADYADAALDAVTAVATPLVVVAQSLGGFTGPVVCARRSASMLVLVNAMIPLPGETAGEWWDATSQPAARLHSAAVAGRAVTDDPFDDFFHDVPAHVVAEATARPQPRQSSAVFVDPIEIESWPDTPTRVIVGADDRFFPADFQVSVCEQRLGITPDVIPGGHLVALSQPVALADRLVGYLDGG